MLNSRTLVFASIVSGVLLTGCATSFDVGSADRTVTPREAAQTPAMVRNRDVAWGGVIANAKNLTDNTQFEIIGYPLDRENRPQADQGPIGRFLIVHPGYLETADYAAGREVTVVGAPNETRTGKVGEASYVYPVVTAKNLYLWPKESKQSSKPTFHFGIGIGILR
jgi:outer membrane lipoprotein